MGPHLQLLQQLLRFWSMLPDHDSILETSDARGADAAHGLLSMARQRSTTWPDEAACAASARRLAAADGLFDASIELQGPLGAGKTTFVRHLLRALGLTGPIKSPTYALIESYEAGGHAVSHFDFYRFADAREWEDAGLREVFGEPGLKLVEWADKAAGMLPRCDLRIDIQPLNGDSRQVSLHSFTPRGAQLLAAVT
jgi:tRNA threonylcarbamoyladenosine biosynthesis protein TsaE